MPIRIVLILAVALAAVAAAAQEASPPAPAPASESAKTAKERLVNKAADEQRVDNCNVPPEQRGTKPRPDSCDHERIEAK